VPDKNSGSFASFLAAFTGKRADDLWDDTALADDVATISYEQALRSHRRVRSPESAIETSPMKPSGVTPQAADSPPPQRGEKKKRKAASITIRLTAAEQTQLQERAAAAQLSVSAYIRSCIFEAESLRAQVKEALAQIHSASPQATATSPEKPIRNWQKRFFSILPRSAAGKAES
jgi:hypothetical protein